MAIAPTKATTSAPVVAHVPFIHAAKEHSEMGDSYSAVALDGKGKFNTTLPPEGWARGGSILVNASGGVGGAATVAAKEDAPYSAISNLLVQTPKSQPLLNLSGFSAFLAQRYGGNKQALLENDTFSFTPVATGAGASGNFAFRLPFWFEFARGGRGCLLNDDTKAAYKVAATFGASGDLYSTPPATTVPSLNGSIALLGRMVPAATDMFSHPQADVPPDNGDYLYWTESSQPITVGANNFVSKAVGNTLRVILLVFRDASSSRSGAETTGVVPATLNFLWESYNKLTQVDVALIRQQAYLKTLIPNLNGIVPLVVPTNDYALSQGDSASEYIPTSTSSKVRFDWTSTAAGTLDVITCEIKSSNEAKDNE